MKKAVLLTLGMVLLSSIIFSLAILLFHNTQGTESRFAELSLYDRLYDLDSSIQRGFKEVFLRNSYMRVTISDPVEDIVFITETLPHSSSNNFIAETEAYAEYIKEMYLIDPKITIYEEDVLSEITGYLPIIIMPHEIEISHTTFPTGNLEITPTDTNIENYSISLTTTQQSVSFDSDIAVPQGLTIPLKIIAIIESGTQTNEYAVDPLLTNTVKLTFSSGGTTPVYSDVTITLENLVLSIDKGSLTITHDIEIALNPIEEQMVYAQYPDSFFTIEFPGESLLKTGTVRIA